tara:strand:+ start:293 stop:2650 length:2358 start_codon:yes stop_codon:yes gene_type:complete
MTEGETKEFISNPNVMDCRTFNELLNPQRVKYLLSIEDKEIYKLFWNKEELDFDGETWDWKVYLNSIRCFLRESLLEIDDDGKLEYERNYRYAGGRDYGRLYTRKFSVQSLQARLRNFLVTDDNGNPFYTDIDIENCHFSILLGLVENYNEITNEENKLEYMRLKKYVKNRKECFKKYKFTKKEALILLNSDRVTQNKKTKGAFYVGENRFLMGLFEEILMIKEAWLENDSYDKYMGDMEGRKNPKSSFLNRILCDQEAKYLQMVIKLLNDGERYIIPMFDGLLVSSQGREIQLLLNDINKLTKAPFGHSIKWVIKPVIDDADILQQDIENAVKDCMLYSVKKADYERQRCFIKSTGSYQNQYKNREGLMRYRNYPAAIMKEEGKNKICISNFGKRSDMFTEWSQDPKRREYEDIDFIPFNPKEEDICDDHIFNTFTGMAFNYDEKYNAEEKDPILKEFLLTTICDNDEEAYEYIYNKLAHIIQEPDTNPQVATILSGAEGVGKDSLIYLIRKIIGKDYVCATNKMEDVIPKKGAFNMQLKDTIVVEFNETSGKDGVDYMEQIKDFITREHNTIRELYKAPYDQKNIIRLFIITNQLNPIQMKDGQRRFIWLKISGNRKGDHEYWDEVYNHFNDPVWTEKIGNELLNANYRDYFREKKYPETEVMQQYYKLNRSKTTDFIWYNIINGENIEGNMVYIETKNLYDKYKDYCEDNALPYGYNGQAWCSSHFQKELLDLGVGDNGRIQHEGKQKRMFSFDLIKIRAKLESKYENDDVIVLDGNCYIMD